MDISWIDGIDDEHGSVFGSSKSIGSTSGANVGNIYEVEHLATFQLSEDVTVPADGMRRLLHMEKNGFGIWSQKMRIRLESRFIVILDFENGEEMERFPLHLIRDPTAFTNPNPGELYNNIFAFIVQPVEMHIFQCFSISAAELVEDVKLALTGRAPPPRIRRNSQGNLPPPPINPPPDPPIFLPQHEDVRDDTSSGGGSEGRYEREVSILNRCFDDIERFIARLQYAAAAWRELQRRRKSKKSKKKEHGEGLMSLRAKPPRERDFVDILQKFKLSFNLLARLKSHIHDPNAPELVHFLFTPLALIVDASKDAHTVGLAATVTSPLLSREAIELLNNCLTSKETELWHSLGDAWLLSRDQFKGYVPPYQPVFMDGWAPTIPESNHSIGQASASESQLRIQKLQSSTNVEELHRERSLSPVEMASDDFGAGQRAFADSIRSRGGRIVIVSHPRTANNQKELTVVRGEYLEVLDDSKKWWKARNWKGQVAHVPHTILTDVDNLYHHQNPNQDTNRSALWSTTTSIRTDGSFDDEGSLPSPTSPSSQPIYIQQQKKEIPKSEDVMQAELKHVLGLFNDRKQYPIEIQKTPEVYISASSKSKDVQEWLRAKEFSDSVINTLGKMDGEQLFGLSKQQLENICGTKEGRRLHSQILVTRNVTGYKTTRSSELRDILAKARAKAESANNEESLKGVHERSPSSEATSADEITQSNTKTNTGYWNNNNNFKLTKNRNSSPVQQRKGQKFNRMSPPSPPLKPTSAKQRNRVVIETDEDEDGDEIDKYSTLTKMLREKRGQMFRK